MVSAKTINVTVITGFLGAGKTTFINHVLKNYQNIQFALVENEFGDASIDTKLIKGIDASQMFELKQGCICCTISDEYELILLELAEKFPQVEHLIIETTGIADPAGVVFPFYKNPEIKTIFKLVKNVCLVDAKNVEKQEMREISIKQIAIADEILINKCEYFTDSQKISLSKKINEFNSLAITHFTEFGASPTFSFTSKVPFKNRILNNLETKHQQIQSKLITINNPVNEKHFKYWLSYHLDVYKNSIFRTKGIICFENEIYEYILQGVGSNFEIFEGESISENNTSVIIFIGINLPDLKYNFEN